MFYTKKQHHLVKCLFSAEEIPTGDVPSVDDDDDFDLEAEFRRIADDQMRQFEETKRAFQVNKNVQDWRKTVQPFLNEIVSILFTT